MTGSRTMRELWIQIVQTSGSKIYSLVTGLVVLSLTARWLGAAGRGEMSAAFVWTNLFFICGFFSLNLVAMHESAKGFDQQTLGRLFANLVAVTIVVTLAGWLIAGTMYVAHPQTFGAVRLSVLALAFAALPFFIWEQYGNALLICIGRLDIYNRATVVAKTVVLVLVGISFALRLSIQAAVIATVAGQIWLSLAGTPRVVRDAGPSIAFDAPLLKRMLIAAVKLHPSAIATYVSAYAGILIVNRYLGNTPTGHFQLATQLIDVMLVVPYAANIVLYGRMSQSGIHDVWPHQRRILAWTTLFMIVQAVVAALLAPFIIRLLAGRQFLPSVPIFRWLLIGAVTGTLGAIMTTQWVGRGLFLQISMVNISAVLITLTLNFILTPRIGINGAIIASVAAYATTAVANLAMVYRCESEWRSKAVPVAAGAEQT